MKPPNLQLLLILSDKKYLDRLLDAAVDGALRALERRPEHGPAHGPRHRVVGPAVEVAADLGVDDPWRVGYKVSNASQAGRVI